ncbi:META domain-containing protein [Hymenobacter metallilatus]|uniref:META domain-containing protein n=1 Tax=Hymenobacter metallilatus TaxID=2493666 RepID=A0A428JT63_9BACT|nr:META domain-containing protein [Hymenobacter metallilatus]RSK37234.1 META domain-containing protein [Hymenobacter metallilatus]
MPLRYASFLAAVALLGGCTKHDEPVPAPVYLLDQRWILTELEGQKPQLQAGSTATDLTLSSVEGSSRGRAFCNQYGGRYTLASGTAALTFSAQGSTYATCGNQQQETRYLQLLPGITRYTIRNRQLYLYDATHPEPQLVFEAAE